MSSIPSNISLEDRGTRIGFTTRKRKYLQYLLPTAACSVTVRMKIVIVLKFLQIVLVEVLKSYAQDLGIPVKVRNETKQQLIFDTM
jgi:hypothetical protein